MKRLLVGGIAVIAIGLTGCSSPATQQASSTTASPSSSTPRTVAAPTTTVARKTMCDILDMGGSTTKAFDIAANLFRKQFPDFTSDDFNHLMLDDLGLCPQYLDAYYSWRSGDR